MGGPIAFSRCVPTTWQQFWKSRYLLRAVKLHHSIPWTRFYIFYLCFLWVIDRVVLAAHMESRPGQQAGPARHGTTPGWPGTLPNGPRGHVVPCGLCLTGLRAWPPAQARARGPFCVPGWPVKHGKNGGPGQSIACWTDNISINTNLKADFKHIYQFITSSV